MRVFASFVAPDLPEMVARGYPDWSFLARRAFISNRQNSTVAHGHTSGGDPVQVSFAAHPPAVSHLRVHCPGREHQFSHNPAVIFSRDDLILFDISFDSGISEYFIYRANDTSLVRIEDPDPNTANSSLFNTGIVRCGTDHFAVAALSHDSYKNDMTSMFKLSVFSYRTRVGAATVLPLELSELPCKPEEFGYFFPTKVIPLKGSLLGWVDMWRGILICDVLSDDPKLHYIPLPERMPGNEEFERDKGEAAFFRDVIGCGDMIKFVEVDYQYDGPEPADGAYAPDDKWTAVTMSRELDSREWERVHEVSSEDVTVFENFHGWADLLPDELCEGRKPSLKKMPIGMPTLCEGNNVLYFLCKLKFEGYNGWVVAVDAESKKLEAVAEYYAVSLLGFSTVFYPSLFSKYLNGNSAVRIQLHHVDTRNFRKRASIRLPFDHKPCKMTAMPLPPLPYPPRSNRLERVPPAPAAVLPSSGRGSRSPCRPQLRWPSPAPVAVSPSPTAPVAVPSSGGGLPVAAAPASSLPVARSSDPWLTPPTSPQPAGSRPRRLVPADAAPSRLLFWWSLVPADDAPSRLLFW